MTTTTEQTTPPALPITAEFVNEAAFLMRLGNVDRKQLARRMGVEPGAVSQMLSGDRDQLTDERLSAIAKALDATWIISLVPNGDPDAYPRTA